MKIYPAPRLTKRHSGQAINSVLELGTGYQFFMAACPRLPLTLEIYRETAHPT